MSALTIVVIRHAEKPDESWPGPGLTLAGVEDDKSLVVRGWQRAGSWSALFGAGRGGLEFPQPSVIYAADPNAASEGSSHRPFATITPLASRLNLTPNVSYAVGQEAQLVQEIVNLTGCVLVSWEHKSIGKSILPAIANGQNIPDMPAKWDGKRFDVVLRFDRSVAGAQWAFRQLFPCLLSDDSDTPM